MALGAGEGEAGPVLRDARSGEAEAIARVHHEVRTATFREFIPPEVLHRKGRTLEDRIEYWRDLLASPGLGRERFAMALEAPGEGIVGLVSGGPAREDLGPYTGHLYQLYLRPAWQGSGWGRRMFEAMAERLRGAGHRAIYLWTPALNARGRGFYERLGGRVIREDAIRVGSHEVVRVAYGWGASLDPDLGRS